ncbi:hypothetical protein [Leptospira borgpetersenii]|uniref:Uncharacterized protein n=3 Tax=Leptospira borgpetersenii TaxID=174 RepID=M3HRQ2_LEPBO|nr:hypothetical protein [Leptospira borgpetersenii]AXX16713.1 hypothetical protein C4Q31_15225 [Leptospira borgpetersenii serovar Ceylonica]EMG00751.1 hypothetical protein LEP1GSC123_0657 [Leptospira borgpetersenii str. 200701203]AXX16754.1 hypothetical protein C4Q31_15565 [Leptospira borgpetersenii serovar Ceylonica]EKP15477.1 hypothetical protein LEP1GSC128_0960 [Leptospira borgpetersenii str. 200801926]EKQ93604.1 hypothetical protein LEP1GSC101_0154 [Leptospira borgpetersenii str. UI 09149]
MFFSNFSPSRIGSLYEFPFQEKFLSRIWLLCEKCIISPQTRNFSWEFPQIHPKTKFSFDYNFDIENWYQYHNNQFIENSPVADNVAGIFLKTFRKL